MGEAVAARGGRAGGAVDQVARAARRNDVAREQPLLQRVHADAEAHCARGQRRRAARADGCMTSSLVGGGRVGAETALVLTLVLEEDLAERDHGAQHGPRLAHLAVARAEGAQGRIDRTQLRRPRCRALTARGEQPNRRRVASRRVVRGTRLEVAEGVPTRRGLAQPSEGFTVDGCRNHIVDGCRTRRVRVRGARRRRGGRRSPQVVEGVKVLLVGPEVRDARLLEQVGHHRRAVER